MLISWLLAKVFLIKQLTMGGILPYYYLKVKCINLAITAEKIACY
jgi:hypothetical protein